MFNSNLKKHPRLAEENNQTKRPKMYPALSRMLSLPLPNEAEKHKSNTKICLESINITKGSSNHQCSPCTKNYTDSDPIKSVAAPEATCGCNNFQDHSYAKCIIHRKKTQCQLDSSGGKSKDDIQDIIMESGDSNDDYDYDNTSSSTLQQNTGSAEFLTSFTAYDKDKQVMVIHPNVIIDDVKRAISYNKHPRRTASKTESKVEEVDAPSELKIESVYSLATEDPNVEYYGLSEQEADSGSLEEPENGATCREDDQITFSLANSDWENHCKTGFVVLERLNITQGDRVHKDEIMPKCSHHCRLRTLNLLCGLSLLDSCNHPRKEIIEDYCVQGGIFTPENSSSDISAEFPVRKKPDAEGSEISEFLSDQDVSRADKLLSNDISPVSGLLPTKKISAAEYNKEHNSPSDQVKVSLKKRLHKNKELLGKSVKDYQEQKSSSLQRKVSQADISGNDSSPAMSKSNVKTVDQSSTAPNKDIKSKRRSQQQRCKKTFCHETEENELESLNLKSLANLSYQVNKKRETMHKKKRRRKNKESSVKPQTFPTIGGIPVDPVTFAKNVSFLINNNKCILKPRQGPVTWRSRSPSTSSSTLFNQAAVAKPQCKPSATSDSLCSTFEEGSQVPRIPSSFKESKKLSKPLSHIPSSSTSSSPNVNPATTATSSQDSSTIPHSIFSVLKDDSQMRLVPSSSSESIPPSKLRSGLQYLSDHLKLNPDKLIPGKINYFLIKIEGQQILIKTSPLSGINLEKQAVGGLRSHSHILNSESNPIVISDDPVPGELGPSISKSPQICNKVLLSSGSDKKAQKVSISQHSSISTVSNNLSGQIHNQQQKSSISLFQFPCIQPSAGSSSADTTQSSTQDNSFLLHKMIEKPPMHNCTQQRTLLLVSKPWDNTSAIKDAATNQAKISSPTSTSHPCPPSTISKNGSRKISRLPPSETQPSSKCLPHELSVEERKKIKRRKLEAKYPLPPGVVIKSEPITEGYLDDNWSITSEADLGFIPQNSSLCSTSTDTISNPTDQDHVRGESTGTMEDDNNNERGNDNMPPVLENEANCLTGENRNRSEGSETESVAEDSDTDLPPVLQPMATLSSFSDETIVDIDSDEFDPFSAISASTSRDFNGSPFHVKLNQTITAGRGSCYSSPSQSYLSTSGTPSASSSSTSLSSSSSDGYKPKPSQISSRLQHLKDLLKRKEMQVENMRRIRSAMPKIDLDSV